MLVRSRTVLRHSFAIFLWCVAASTCSAFTERVAWPNCWELTRTSAVVLKGTVIRVDANVTLAVSTIFKGKDVPETVQFAAPPIPEEQHRVIICGGPRVLRFIAGKPCIVFLQENQAGRYSLVDAAMRNLLAVEKSIQDVLRFDRLVGDDREKCKMLVGLALPWQGFSSGYAMQELSNNYNKAEFCELLEPLAEDPTAKIYYIYLLGDNPNPVTTSKLREFLRKTERKDILLKVIWALQRKNVEDTGLSKELLKYITHEAPEVRRDVIFTLKYRGYMDALPQIFKCLDDEHPMVRSISIYYLSSVRKNPEVLAKINKLTHDPDENVRAEAYRSLPRQVSSFYRLFWASLFDKARNVRVVADKLDLIWERKPLVISLLLLWPSIVVTGLVVYASRGTRWSWRILMVVVGIVAGYLAGVVAGCLIGEFHSCNPIFHSFILIPPVFMPVGVLLSGAVYRYGRKAPVIIFSLFTAVICVAIRIVTLSNTLWPCMLAGFFVLGTIISLSVLRQPVADRYK